MQNLGLLISIHPENLTSEVLIRQLFQILNNPLKSQIVDLEGLSRITNHIRDLLVDKITDIQPEITYCEPNPIHEFLAS